MPNRKKSLAKLIETERSLYDAFAACMMQYPEDTDRIDAAAQNHHEGVKDILEAQPFDIEELKSKCRFLFTLLKRNYDDPYLKAYEEIIISDIESVLKRSS